MRNQDHAHMNVLTVAAAIAYKLEINANSIIELYQEDGSGFKWIAKTISHYKNNVPMYESYFCEVDIRLYCFKAIKLTK